MMEAARFFGTWTKCLSRSIGAVIVRDKTILSTGYNGPPRGVFECGTSERLSQIIQDYFNAPCDVEIVNKLHQEWGTKCPRQILGFKSGEGLNLCIAAHAEANAVANAAREGVRITGAVMYCHCGLPCQECSKIIIGAGIAKIFYLWTEQDYDRQSRGMLRDAGVRLIPVNPDLLSSP
jgi:dCMP deaminase